MSEKLMLPREWTRKTQAPVWKAAAIASWAFSFVLAQCLVIVLAWPGLARPAAPPPPEPPPAPAPPALPPVSHNGVEIQVSNSLARVRCLVNVGRSQEALAETIRCLTLCQRAQIDPPPELPGLFAQTVASMSGHGKERTSARPVVRPETMNAPPPPPPPLISEQGPPPLCGRVPGPGYPLAHRADRPRNDNLAQLPQPPLPMGPPMMLPEPPAQSQPGPYSFQPPRQQQGPPPGGFPPPPPGYDSPPSYPTTPY